MFSGTGRRSIASPVSSLERPPAENLQHSQVKMKSAHRIKRKSSKSSTWLLVSWNVRSLLYCEGAVETARQRTEVGQFDDRRIDQVTRELERYQIFVCALQETKWFGEAMYKVEESIVLAAGRPTPLATEP